MGLCRAERREAERFIQKNGGMVMAHTVLIVEDDPNIADLLHLYLEKDGYTTEIAPDGGKAVEKFRQLQPDLVLLDVMLPVMDGWEVLRTIRQESKTPVIMLTAKGETNDKVNGLKMGADDYITKPFIILEVKARIKTILRRTAASSQNDVRRTIRVHDMEINSVNRSVTLGGNEVRLTAKEFDLLQVFVNNRGKVFSRESLLETVWKYDYTGDARTVDVHIRRLREKIERNPAQPEFIFTKWGVGYYFTDKD